MCNAPATFQCLFNIVLAGVPNCSAYNNLDNLVVYNTTGEDHVTSLRNVFARLAKGNLNLTLADCEFGKAITYLGKQVAKDR